MEFSFAKPGLFVVWLVFSIFVGIFASIRRRSGLAFFTLSLLLSPLVGFLIAFYITPNTSRA